MAPEAFQVPGQAYYNIVETPEALDLSGGLPGITTAPTLFGPKPPPVYDAALCFVELTSVVYLFAGQGYHDLSAAIWALQL